jgi:hypothetical protein
MAVPSKPLIRSEGVGRARVVAEAAATVGAAEEILLDDRQTIIIVRRTAHAEDQAEDRLVEAEAEAVTVVAHHRRGVPMPVEADQPETVGRVVPVEGAGVKEEDQEAVVVEDRRAIMAVAMEEIRATMSRTMRDANATDERKRAHLLDSLTYRTHLCTSPRETTSPSDITYMIRFG